MDVAPIKNEIVPIRFFLSPYELTPTYQNVNNKFSVHYIINLVFVGDERICDGHYYAASFRSLVRYLTHPELLEINLEKKNIDPEL